MVRISGRSGQRRRRLLIEALIFDVDGTLAEAEQLHRRAFSEVFAEAGLDWHWDRGDYRKLLKTTGGKERMARCARARGIGAEFPVVDLHAAKTARYGALMAQRAIALRPGIAELIGEAHRANLRLAISTTTSLPNVEALSQAVFGVAASGVAASGVFEVIVAGDMVAAKKPAPDVYLMALKLLGLAPHQATALEDSRNGMLAAKVAGLVCCVTPGVYTSGEDFSEADGVVAHLPDLGGLAGLLVLGRQRA